MDMVFGKKCFRLRTDVFLIALVFISKVVGWSTLSVQYRKARLYP